jgi:hypothetical protein
MVKTIIIIALIVVVLSMLAMFIRIIKGPTLPDRVLAAVPKKAKIPISKITTSKYCEPINTLYNATHAINCNYYCFNCRSIIDASNVYSYY